MKFKDMLKRILGRGLFHIGAFALAAGLAFSSPWASHASTFLVSLFSTYFALILMFPMPRGSLGESRYAVPVVGGGVAALLLDTCMALSPCAALFAGGSLSFILRRIICRPSSASDWLELIPFILGWLIWLPQFGTFTADFMIVGVVLSVGVAAWGIYRIAHVFEERRTRSCAITDAVLKLESFASDPEIPPKIRTALRNLSEDLAGGKLDLGTDAEDAMVKLCAALVPVKRHVDPDTGRTLSKVEYEICTEGALQLADALADKLHRASKPAVAKDDPLTPFEMQCRRFEMMERERGILPTSMLAELGRIGRAGRQIVSLVYEDPAKYESGTAFLKRHLGFADHIVSECVHLAAQGQNEDLERVYKRSSEVLSLLSSVFESQARDLTRRDFAEFEAELKSFEAFMRMHGR